MRRATRSESLTDCRTRAGIPDGARRTRRGVSGDRAHASLASLARFFLRPRFLPLRGRVLFLTLLRRVAGERQEDVVQRRAVQGDVGESDPRVVQPSDRLQQGDRTVAPDRDPDTRVLLVDTGRARPHAGERLHHASEVRAVLDVQLHDLAADLVLELVGGSQGDHGADVDHGDPVRELIGLFEVLGGEQQGGAFVLQLTDEVPHVDPAPRVEARRRLVEEQDLRTPHQARGQVQPPAHAAGVRLRRTSRGIRQLEPRQDLLGTTPRLRLREVVQPSDELEVLEAGQVLVDRRALSREADPEPQLLGVAHGVQPVDLRSAAGGREQGGQDPDRGRLAGPVRPEQPEHRAGLDLEVDPLERLDVAEVLDERFCADDHIAHERVMVAAVTDTRPPFLRPGGDGTCGTLPSPPSRVHALRRRG